VGLIERLGEGPSGLDAAIFIYFIERSEEWRSLVHPLFKLAEQGKRTLVTSELTLQEVLVLPYRTGNFALAERYEDLLQRSTRLALVPVDRTNLKHAAMLRARYRAKGADSIQLAAALTSECTSFVTNDRKIPEIPGLRILQLNELR
jgi:predicted nucleic acid-binding protein